jgi:LPXTG-motif cell wall-anchored protein
MKRHTFDALSFTFALLFIAVSVMLWLGGFDITGNDLQWFGAGGLLLLGASLLLSSRKRSRDER